jgi:hypothetical protein
LPAMIEVPVDSLTAPIDLSVSYSKELVLEGPLCPRSA